MSTFKFSDVTTLLAKGIPKSFMDDNAAIICNMALNKIWMKYDWRESLAIFPPVYVLPCTQDIGSPLTVIPADLAGLREIKLRKTNGVASYDKPLSVERLLEPTEYEGTPNAICYIKDLGGIRLHPRPSAEFCAPNYFLTGKYKKLPVKITSATLGTLLPFDDIYFQVWLETARWAAFSVLGDPKAGNVQGSSSQKYTSGQLAVADALIDEMAFDQGVNEGDVSIAPSDPLWGGYCA